MPDTTWPISRHPPGSIPGWAGRPVSMPSIAVFDTSSVVRSRSPSWPTPDALTARLSPRTLTTTALDRSSSGWFAASPRRATADDHRPRRPAPPSPMQHRINQSNLLHRPPQRVRGTPCRLRSPKRPLSRITRPYARGRTEPPAPKFSCPELRASGGSAIRSRAELLLWKTRTAALRVVSRQGREGTSCGRRSRPALGSSGSIGAMSCGAGGTRGHPWGTSSRGRRALPWGCRAWPRYAAAGAPAEVV
jgi:hypothetical protein